MDDDVDCSPTVKPTPEDMRRALEYIARYGTWDFSKVQEPWRWCNEFIDVARTCLAGKDFLV
jgi:hypothetical protein